MSNISDNLHDLLSQEFDYERGEIFEFGWCNIIDAEDRLSNRAVRIYVPKESVASNAAAKKKIRAQFKAYDGGKLHECLPEPFELLEGKKAAGEIALVTHRSEGANLMAGERAGTGASWQDFDRYKVPQKLGAITKFVQAVEMLHQLDNVQGSLGHQTISCLENQDSLMLQIDLLNFGDVASTEPAPSLFFEPAFTAPELFDDGDESDREPAFRSRITDVYSIGKFLIYFLLGPEKFIKFFTGDKRKGKIEPAQVYDKLVDHDLWRNLTDKKTILASEDLEALSNEKISPELAEFMVYMVAPEPEDRPADGRIVQHGLSTIMGGEIAESVTPAAVTMMREKPDMNPKMLIGASAFSMLMILGMWFFWNNMQNKKNMGVAQVACDGFFGQLKSLEKSGISSFEGWQNVTGLRDQVRSNGKSSNLLQETAGLCEQGTAEIGNAKFGYIESLKTQIATSLENGAKEKADFSSLDLETRRAAAAKAQKDRLFEETEEILVSVLGDVSKQRRTVQDKLLTDELTGLSLARGLMKMDTPEPSETALIERANEMLASEATPKSVENIGFLKGELSKFNLARLTKEFRVRVAKAENNAEKLTRQEASQAELGFDQFVENLKALKAAKVPTTLKEHQTNYAGLVSVENGFEEISKTIQDYESELPVLKDSITDLFTKAESNRWSQVPEILKLRETFGVVKQRSVVNEWRHLKAVEVDTLAQLDSLTKRREEGSAVCQSLEEKTKALKGVKETSIWYNLESILSNTRGIDITDMTPDLIKRCGEGFKLLTQGEFEARSKSIRAEVKQRFEKAQADGIGGYIPEFLQASATFIELNELPIPKEPSTYDVFAAKGRVVTESLQIAETTFAKIKETKTELTAQMAALTKEAEDKKLKSYPEFKALFANSGQEPAKNPLEENDRMRTSIAALSGLLEQFNAGTLINCSVGDGLFLTPLNIQQDNQSSAADIINNALIDAGVELTLEPNVAGTFCLQDKPVSMKQMTAFAKTLSTKQVDIKTEIAKLKKGRNGVATNVSYWLATRFAKWVDDGTPVKVCVAPLLATYVAPTVAPDVFGAMEGGEVHLDRCGGVGAVSKRLTAVYQGSSPPRMGCESSGSLLPEMSFRLAAGSVCTGDE